MPMPAAAPSMLLPALRPARPGAHPWLPDQGDGTYRNPILHADYSDPDAIRVGDDFWLTASSFNCTPGLPILHSPDLVNWTLVGHALKNLPHPRYEQAQPGCGVWAPAIRFHAGRYWIFFPTPDEGIYLVTANHPAGRWSEPQLVQAGRGLIDPCPLWDDDGQAYLVHAYAGSRAGIKHRLRVCPMAPDGSRLLGKGEVIFHQPERHPTLEGPKFLKRDGWYYILAPAGGVEGGWQVALRSRHIYGPYEDRIVLAQGDTDINGPHQGALVDTPAGDWWFLHFQDAGLYGRIVHLQPVHWQDGWPLMGRDGEPVLRHRKPRLIPGLQPCAPATSDEFTDTRLGPQWQWHANHRDDWCSLAARPGWLRLFPQMAVEPLNQQPNLLLQKFPARGFSVETALEFAPRQDGEETGLVIAGSSQAMLGLQREGARNRIVFRTGNARQVVAETTSATITFRVEVEDGGRCGFSYAEGGVLSVLAETFQARQGTWIGAKLGLYSVKRQAHAPAGFADVDYFRFG
jgi:beta-xylosidase